LPLNLQIIPRLKTITKANFLEHFYKPQKPVIIERLIEDWPAYTKWNLDYIKSISGNILLCHFMMIDL